MTPVDHALSFGPFVLQPAQRVLREDGRPVQLGSRAFELLLALVERPGQVLSTQELLARVWPGAVVEPGSVRVHLSTLRKALGDGRAGRRFIVNVPPGGYCFVEPLRAAAEAPAPAPAPEAEPELQALQSLPMAPALIGREELVEELLAQLPQRRLLSLVGPGGIGKTSLALAALPRLAGAHAQGLRYVELAPQHDEPHVLSAVAAALGLALPAREPLAAFGAFLRGKRMLIVLDNCEHVIEVVARLAEALLQAAPQVHLLVTSREPLRIPGEWVQRLGSLRAPPAGCRDAAEVLAYPAAQLFVERASAALGAISLEAADAEALTEICRGLDGIPLAIELAAASVDAFGLRGLAAQLDHGLALLTHGRRTAQPRHRTLRATLDWSHGLLSEAEQRLLRRLALFKRYFTLEAALAVCEDEGGAGRGGGGDSSVELLAGLVAKSLVNIDMRSEPVQYWLLEVTREYAAERLAASGEGAALARRHAAYQLSLAGQATAERERLPPPQWLARYGRGIADLRAAMAWALGPQGDPALGAALLAQSAPLWFGLSLMAEYRQLAARVLAEEPADPALALALHEAYGHALWHTAGADPATSRSFGRALELAEQQGALAQQLRALWGLWLICNTNGDYAGSVRLAERFGEIVATRPDPATRLTHERMMALGLHLHGEQARACGHAQYLLDQPVTVNLAARNSGFQFDQRVAALTVMARTLWIHGRPEEALRCAREAVQESLLIGHSLSLCYAVANGCAPVAFWCGETALAREFNTLLLAHAGEHSLAFWQAFGEGYALLLREGGPPVTLRELTHPAQSLLLLETMCTVQPQLMDERLLARADAAQGGWCAAELLRVKGETLRTRDPLQAEALFRQGLALAERQQARAWALRCATSLMRLLDGTARAAEGRTLLAEALARFDEGHAMPDLRAAHQLLA